MRSLCRLLLLVFASEMALGNGGSTGFHQERIVFSNITESRGMPPGEVTELFQDRKGIHWVATSSGLAKFDGFELTTFLSGSGEVPFNIVAIAQDVDSSLWLGTDGNGLYRFDPVYGIRKKLDVSNGLAHDSITSLQSDANGNLWIGTRAGLNRLNRTTLEFESVSLGEHSRGEVLGLQFDPDGTLWASLANVGVFRKKEDGPWKLVWKTRTAEMETALDADGSLWVYLPREGLMELSGTGNGVRLHEISRRVLDEASVDGKVYSMAVDSFGDVWLGCGKGLIKYVVQEKRWARFEHNQANPGSLIPGKITQLFEDRRNVMWLGSSEGEMSWFNPSRYWFPGFSAEENSVLFSNEINGFSAGQNGVIWIATGRGLNQFDPRRDEFRRVYLKGERPENEFTEVLCALEDQQGRLWVGTREDGLALRMPGEEEFHFFTHSAQAAGSIPKGAVPALFEDQSGSVWAAVLGSGIVKFISEEGGKFQRYLPARREAELFFVNDFEEDGEQGAWLATVGGGLWHLNTETGLLREHRELIRMEEALPSDNLIDVLRGRDGHLWIGTFGGGLLRICVESGTLERFSRDNGGLPDWSAFGLVEDHEGMIWVSTGSGLVRIDPNAGGGRRFGIQDGLQAMAFRPRSVARLPDSRLLFGGSDGFNLIDPDRLPAEAPPPRPLLVGLELYGEPVKPSAEGWLLQKPLALTDELRIPFDPRMRFSLQYGTLNYASEGQVQFRFRMDPHEDKWQAGTKDHRASYYGLKPGEYQFTVQTSRDGETWNGSTAGIRVAILPPWYRTWWARFLGITLLVTGSIVLTRFLHAQKMMEQEAERERLENARSRAETALARQLQDSMLVEQTGADFRKGLSGKAVFESTLERLAHHFELDRCLIYWEPLSEDAGGGRILAEFVREGTDSIRTSVNWAGNETLAQVFGYEKAVSFEWDAESASASDRREWQECWGKDAKSVLAVRTFHEERANGVLVLEQCAEYREWNEDERNLTQSVAGQLGLVLAQFELSEREAHNRRELEEARQKADSANQAKGEFLAKMTHELRTPLNAIIGFSEILEREQGVVPEQRKNLDIIGSSAEHLLGVINDVLEISKLEAGKAELFKEEVGFEKMIKSVHGMLSVNADKKGLRFELVPLNELPGRIEIDKSKLRQILINLLANAIKFTHEGGVSLRVRADYPETQQDMASRDRRPVELTFEVLDTGDGISEAEQKTLFEKFVQTKTGKASQQGTGLGLSIAKGFTDLMGGTITVSSRVGLGTLFTVKLPVWEILKSAGASSQTKKGTVKVEEERDAAAKVPPGLRVMVVEDRDVNRLLLKNVLLKVGCIMEEAEDGQVAVDKWKDFNPDIILMDESMPVMCGSDATRKILEEAGDDAPYIISLTAYATTDQREAALDAGCVDFLTKPFKQDDLFRLLNKYGSEGPALEEAA